MTSQINFGAISTTYPVAGVDNNSQGFRDNFTAISAGLAVAKTELSITSQCCVKSKPYNQRSGQQRPNWQYHKQWYV